MIYARQRTNTACQRCRWTLRKARYVTGQTMSNANRHKDDRRDRAR